MYLWQRPDWPDFTWNDAQLLEPLAKARLQQGRLLGSMAQLGFLPTLESQVEAQTEEVVRSSSIEGETLSRPAVRSSVARRLGLPEAAAAPVDRRTDGVVAMMLDATGNLAEPLTAERLIGWQAALFPTGYADLIPVRTGNWRDDACGCITRHRQQSGSMAKCNVSWNGSTGAPSPKACSAPLSLTYGS